MAKQVVLCLDGTNNQPLNGRTNVSRLFRMLAKGAAQHVYYQPGVGTLEPFRGSTAVGRRLRRWWDLATAWMIKRHALSAYRFLCDTWSPGDDIFLFGFSRGAFLARIVAGMVQRVGLIHPGHAELADTAWLAYAGSPPETAGRFKRYFARAAKVKFLGLWDTVRSVGTPWSPKAFPHTYSNPAVRIVRHALALDERRGLYPTNLFKWPPPKGQDLLEVWFPGAHADVGGGYDVAGGAGIGSIPLLWVAQHAHAAGLALDWKEVMELTWRKGKQPPPELTIEEVTKEFAEDPRHDESRARWHWRLLEQLPMPHWEREVVIRNDGSSFERWNRSIRRHRRRPRPIAEHTHYHYSIKAVMERDGTYRPSLEPNRGFVW